MAQAANRSHTEAQDLVRFVEQKLAQMDETPAPEEQCSVKQMFTPTPQKIEDDQLGRQLKWEIQVQEQKPIQANNPAQPVQQPVVQAQSQQAARHAPKPRPVVNYADLKAAKKRKRTDDDSDKKPTLAQATYQANGKRNQPTAEGSLVVKLPLRKLEKAETPVIEDESKDESSTKNSFVPDKKPWKTNATYISKEVVNLRKVPNWYADTNMREKHSRGDLQTIAHVRDIIKRCLAVRSPDEEETLKKHFVDLRLQIQRMRFYEFLSKIIVKKSRILEEDGLLQIFDGPEQHKFPWDIRLDAKALWLRWTVGEFDGHLLRGIIVTKGVLSTGAKRTSRKLDKDYTDRRSPNVVGSNDLVNGEWWPLRICALRDGAHGEVEGGIHGQTGKGAYSVVVAEGGYADNDNGATIEYCGTASQTSEPTANTVLLQEAFARDQPLRVLRAANKKSKYAPSKGIRYDGLYKIVGREVLDVNTATYRFSLKRVEGQDPIRYKGVEVRPNDQELKEEMKIKAQLA